VPGLFKCPEPSCSYSAKTKGAITAHANREHGDDPVAKVRAMIPGAPTPGGAFRMGKPLEAMPSGVPSVDYAIGIGGVPCGTVVEIFGESASGKSLLAMTFSAHAQAQGLRAGYMDAERALQETFVQLVPGLDLHALEYGVPPGEHGDPEPFDGTGEAALEATRQFIATSQFAIWTVDSVAACVPREEQRRAIGDSASMAALAKLMRSGLRVLTPVAERTGTVLVFVNHVTAVPGVKYGRDWSKPAEKTFNYFASIQLHVTVGTQYFNREGRRIGHEVRVRVHKSKVAAPHAKAAFDLFNSEDRVVPKPSQKQVVERDVIPGVDIASSWFSVLQEAGQIGSSGGYVVDLMTGERLGRALEVKDSLEDEESPLYRRAFEIVYPERFRRQA